MKPKEIIARRIAKEFKDGDVLNLGFGIPNLSAAYLPADVKVTLQAENGALKFGPPPTEETLNPDYSNSGGMPLTFQKGASTFSMLTSFAIIRGGHVDCTALGALEVDQEGSIANWMVPGVLAPGMGGAMDLLVGAKRVIASLQHCDKHGNSKVLKKCTLPLSAKSCLDLIITDLAVFEFQAGKLLLVETAPGVSVEDVLAKTEADVIVSDNVKVMDI
ncbi:3-oxoacid CoA-transferase subunit B [Ignavigranum ruoffiae]|uniref:3-oxoacid CoA-transferase subunit B n=1 Tax=Ignavigranum ruoffiae TaxID=89093 RepID=A0A1H9CT16_9LACT|nr:3-oxoacid CoA-transferase subunit B [Ignavigranum ruoffiae]UPQ84997.1 3-oxoacid CoA-transferase subunit B [Ignavigranum ruoffiae]SEQ04314.1 3-oxoacid CoA-transferase subunit B [Ignavigranum ruoffiae]